MQGLQRHDVVEAGETVIELNAVAQGFQGALVNIASDAHPVFARDFGTGVHQAVGEGAVVGEEQEAGGVEVEAANADPATLAYFRQAVKDAGAAFGIVAGADFARRFVVHQDLAWGLLFRRDTQRAAVQAETFVPADGLADCGRFAVYFETACADPVFDFAARALTTRGQPFLDTFFGFFHAGSPSSSGRAGSASRLATEKSFRNWVVVANSSGRPGTSLVPMTSIHSRSKSWR